MFNSFLTFFSVLPDLPPENCEICGDAFLIIIGIATIAVTGGVLYALFKDMLSGDTPQDFFQYGSDKCINHEKVQDLLGEPVKAYGVRTRRHASKHVK